MKRLAGTCIEGFFWIGGGNLSVCSVSKKACNVEVGNWRAKKSWPILNPITTWEREREKRERHNPCWLGCSLGFQSLTRVYSISNDGSTSWSWTKLCEKRRRKKNWFVFVIAVVVDIKDVTTTESAVWAVHFVESIRLGRHRRAKPAGPELPVHHRSSLYHYLSTIQVGFPFLFPSSTCIKRGQPHEIAIDFLLSRYNIRNPIFFIDFHYCRLWEH